MKLSEASNDEKSSAMDKASAKWKQRIGDAKIAWGKLTDDQLMRTEGQHQKLVGLVQEKYNITRQEAHKQVLDFTEKNRF